MKKKLLSVLLVVCMVLTLMPMAAFAVAETTATGTIEVDENSGLSGNVTVELADTLKFADTADSTSFTVTVGDVVIEVDAVIEDAAGKTAGDSGVGDLVKAVLSLAKDNATGVTADNKEVVIRVSKDAVDPVAAADITVKVDDVEVTVEEGEPTPPPPTTYTVSGTVSEGDIEGLAVEGITVTLTGTNPVVAAVTTETDEEGGYKFENVAAGTYKLTIEATEDYAKVDETVTVTNASVTKDITLTAAGGGEDEPGTYTVSGTVKKGNTVLTTSDLAGIAVVLYIEKEGEDGEPFLTATDYEADTDEGGVFTIADVPAGEYYAVVKPAENDASALYADSQSSKITVTNKDVTGVTVTLKPVMVTLTLSSSPAKGGSVSAKVDNKAVPTGDKNVAKGKDVVLTFTPANEYYLSDLTINDVQPDDFEEGMTTYTIEGIDADTAVVASFDQKMYEVTVECAPEDAIGNSTAEIVGEADEGGANKFAKGEIVKIKATPGTATDEDENGEEVTTTFVTASVEYVIGEATKKYTLKVGDDGYYSFTMPGDAVAVTVTFTALTVVPEEPYVDETALATATAGLTEDTDKEAFSGAMDTVSIGLPDDGPTSVDAYIEADASAKAKILEEVGKATEGAEVTVNVYAQVTPKSYVPLPENATDEQKDAAKLVVDVSMMYQVVVDGTEKTPAKLTVNDPVKVTIGIPEGFAAKDEKVYVEHRSDVHEVTVQENNEDEDNTYLYVEVEANGLSDFTVYATNQSVAQIGTSTAAKYYTSLAAAIEAVEADGTATIKLLKDVVFDNDAEEIVVSKAATITIDANGKTFTPNDKIVAGDGYEVAVSSNIYTFSAKEKFAVDVEVSGGNGTASVDKEEAYEGETVTISVSPVSGYTLDEIVVKDEDNGDVELIGKTFTMPAKAVTVTVTFKVGSTTKPSSSGGSSVAPTVSVAKANGGSVGITNPTAKKGDTVTITARPDKGNEVGTVTVTDKNGNKIEVTDIGNNKYTFVMPDGKVTIKVTFVNKETGEVIPGPSVDFTDVAEGTYYYDAVAWAVEFGITNGIGENIFGPNSSCTRAQMVTFLWRLAGEPEASGTNPFADVAEDSYYYNAVLWAVSNGITNGTGENTFSPDATVTRGQSVTFLYRYAGQPTGAESSSFVDVAADAYYAAAVDWAAANGVTNGNGVDTFGPNDACTRAQIVTFMYRYAG